MYASHETQLSLFSICTTQTSDVQHTQDLNESITNDGAMSKRAALLPASFECKTRYLKFKITDEAFRVPSRGIPLMILRVK